MTRYAMVADLRRCVGCQTCTAACKVSNSTVRDIQWRWVLDIEAGEFPEVTRTFVPVGCQHCAEPPCVEVCPTGATGVRPDGIVFMNYDTCIGCGYCAVACPYQARYRLEGKGYAYATPMETERNGRSPLQLGTVSKCNFCSDKVDAGRKRGLVPGVDSEATPACVNSCIASALYFGDINDETSIVARLVRENETFRMHEELGTKPSFYYLWDKKQ